MKLRLFLAIYKGIIKLAVDRCIIICLKGDDKMRESRLFHILYELLEHGQSTAPKLAAKFEVSVRTIYRDIDALSAAGIPIYAESGRNGGIRLMDDFTLKRTLFSAAEQQDILTALQSVAMMQDDHFTQVKQKLSALFHTQLPTWLEIDFSRWGMQESDHEKFITLKTAILQCHKLCIIYVNSNGERSERIIEPYTLAYRSNAWYLKAYCTQKQGWRLFKLNRILSVNPLSEVFVPKAYDMPKEEVSSNVISLTLRFPATMAYRVYDEFNDSQVIQEKGGDLLVKAKMVQDDWLIAWLLSFGSAVSVLDPPQIKESLWQAAKKTYETHKP